MDADRQLPIVDVQSVSVGYSVWLFPRSKSLERLSISSSLSGLLHGSGEGQHMQWALEFHGFLALDGLVMGTRPGAIDSGILLHLGRLSQMRCSTCFTGSRACLGGLVYLVLHRRDRGTLGADASRKKGVAYPHVPRSRCQSGMSIGTRWRYSTNRLPKRLIKATSSRLARLT